MSRDGRRAVRLITYLVVWPLIGIGIWRLVYDQVEFGNERDRLIMPLLIGTACGFAASYWLQHLILYNSVNPFDDKGQK